MGAHEDARAERQQNRAQGVALDQPGRQAEQNQRKSSERDDAVSVDHALRLSLPAARMRKPGSLRTQLTSLSCRCASRWLRRVRRFEVLADPVRSPRLDSAVVSPTVVDDDGGRHGVALGGADPDVAGIGGLRPTDHGPGAITFHGTVTERL